MASLEESEQVRSQLTHTLTEEELSKLNLQDSRIIPSQKASKLEEDSQRNWDLFYKRNGNRFYKDRQWTRREFCELLGDDLTNKKLLEVGCGVGNFAFPLIENGLDLFLYVCDFSPRAIEFVQNHELYDTSKILAFQCDITKDELNKTVTDNVDFVSLIFVLSAIHPDKVQQCITNFARVVKPGGMVLFRDYGRYDMAQLRFKPGSKIAENFYVRQDGTRAYYFTLEELEALFTKSGFSTVNLVYVHRRTTNRRKGIDIPRIFVQGKFKKD